MPLGFETQGARLTLQSVDSISNVLIHHHLTSFLRTLKLKYLTEVLNIWALATSLCTPLVIFWRDLKVKSMTMGRYLFLDFDGVLHTDTPPRDLRYACHLVPIVSHLNLKVVVSSTWREAYSLHEVIQLLGELGQFVVGKTPVWKPPGNLPLIGVRHREIEAWLAKKASHTAPWVAIDDDADNFRRGCERVFFTDRKVGLDSQTTVVFDAWCKKLFSQMSNPELLNVKY